MMREYVLSRVSGDTLPRGSALSMNHVVPLRGTGVWYGIPGVALRSTPGYSRCAADAAELNHQVSDRVAVTFD